MALSPPREAKTPPLSSPSRFLTTLTLEFFLASLSNLACSCASRPRRALRSSYSRAACSQAFFPFSADLCLSTSHSAHVRRASSGDSSAVAFPSSSSRHSGRVATSTRRSSLECCSDFFFFLAFLRFSRAASNSSYSSFSFALLPSLDADAPLPMKSIVLVLVAFVFHHLGYEFELIAVTWV